MAWLFARSQGARFLVRMEDLDPQRCRAEFEQLQLDELQLLGLNWDGPVVRQSERRPLYDEAIRRLEEQDRLYPCFCTRAEIRDAASAPHGALPEGAYPGTCRTLTRSERRRRASEGRPATLRLRAREERVSFIDRLLGPQSVVVDDFVVQRSDGVPAYQLAVVVDDAAQGVGEVVRGADLAPSTPRQLLLGRLLGLPTPTYAHVGLVVGADGTRLAKRHRAATLPERREAPEAMLVVLAHSLGLALEAQRLRSPAELLEEFDPQRLPREPVILT